MNAYPPANDKVIVQATAKQYSRGGMDVHSDADPNLLGPAETTTVAVLNLIIDPVDPALSVSTDFTKIGWWLLIYPPTTMAIQAIISFKDNSLIFQPPSSQSEWRHSSGGFYSNKWRVCLTFRRVGIKSL